MPYPRISEEFRSEILREMMIGENLKDIAESLQVHYHTVRKYRNKMRERYWELRDRGVDKWEATTRALVEIGGEELTYLVLRGLLILVAEDLEMEEREALESLKRFHPDIYRKMLKFADLE